jgi:serine protease Do
LLNIEGEVVGINTAIYSKSGGYMGIGFAIPINMAIAIKDQLVTEGKVTRGFLGIVIQELTVDLAESFGLKGRKGILVAEVEEGSAAAAAGIVEGDIILTLNGKAADDVGRFRNEVASNPPGTMIKLTIYRDGSEKKLRIRTGTLPDQAVADTGSSGILDQLGFSVEELTPETVRHFGYKGKVGVVVASVEPGGTAWRAGIKRGHLIVAVNRKRVSTLSEFTDALEQSGDKVLLRITDGRHFRFAVLPLK